MSEIQQTPIFSKKFQSQNEQSDLELYLHLLEEEMRDFSEDSNSIPNISILAALVGVLEARSKYLLRKGDEPEQAAHFAKTAAHYRERLDEWIYATAKGEKPRPC